jgi:hypothetical protein
VAMQPVVATWVESAFGPIGETFFEVSHLSSVTGVRLEDGHRIVVKVRGGLDRARACVAGQAALHDDGFPCPAPLSPVMELDGLAVHVEEYIPGHRYEASPDVHHADELASLLADLLVRSQRLNLPRPEPAPMWLAWDHPGSASWPPLEEQPPQPEAMASQGWLHEIVERLRARLSDITGPMVVGHGDWEAQNMAWRDDGRGVIVHDWDSLAYRPEAAIVGAAAATFTSGAQPTLAPIDVSARFIDTYQRQVKRTFTNFESEIAWAAGLWLAAHNARMELLYGKPRLVHSQLAEEAPERLRRAGA